VVAPSVKRQEEIGHLSDLVAQFGPAI